MGTILTSFIHLAHLWALFGYGLNVLWSGSEYLLFALQAVWVLKTQISPCATFNDKITPSMEILLLDYVNFISKKKFFGYIE